MTIKITTIFFIICFSLATTSCVRPAVKPDIEPKPNIETKPAIRLKPSNGVNLGHTEPYSANELLKFTESYADLSPPAQKKALANTHQVLSANPNDLLHRMKLVMIYGLPSSSLIDTPKAQQLLQQILLENILQDSQLAFAHVMFDYIVALKKLSKSAQNDDKRLEQLQLKLEDAQQKLEAAQQQVNELKNIEKSMGEREAAPINEITPKNRTVN